MKNRKVLIIDDSSTVRTRLKAWLENETVDVLEEENGLLGYEKIKSMENELDLIIIDVNMPGLDGITMLKMLKENKLGSSVPKIILTTEVSTSLNIDIKNETENVKTWVIKPINKKKLVSIIKRIDPDWYIL